jgi:hypothetical protein
MYARLLASFGLLCVSTSLVRSESVLPATSLVDVYLKASAADSPAVLDEMSRELTSLMQEAGFRIEIHRPGDLPSAGGVAQLIMVDLRGACAVPSADAQPLVAPVALASSAVSDGRVLPFSWVDCTALSRFLRPEMSGPSSTDQEYRYGRSMARLMAHEFYHILGQTDAHTATGIAKARFSTSDLLAEHFDFEAAALQKLHPAALPSSNDDGTVGGR